MKIHYPCDPYKNYYHVIASVKGRVKAFETEDMRETLAAAIVTSAEKLPNTTVKTVATAYSHFHALVQSTQHPSVVAKRLFGATSRIIRKEYPMLLEIDADGLWGSKTIIPIKNEAHLKNCYSYITRHNPDNSKQV